MATLVEGDLKAPFSIATIPRCREGRFSTPWIAPLYPWSLPGRLYGSNLDNAKVVFACIIVGSWVVSDGGCGDVISVSMVCGTGVLGLWNLVGTIDPDPVLVVGKGFNDVTCCVPSAGAQSLYCNYLSLLKGA